MSIHASFPVRPDAARVAHGGAWLMGLAAFGYRFYGYWFSHRRA